MIRVGIIGCGKIAQVRHLPEYAANPNAEIVAFYDKNMERAQEMAAQYGGKVYNSFYELVDDPNVDAVSICVENRQPCGDLHGCAVRRQARAGGEAHGGNAGGVRVHGGRR